MNRDEIALWRSIYMKCARVRTDLSDNVETLRRAIPAVTNEPSEGTRQQLEPTFHMVIDNLLDMQYIIDLWSPVHSCYHQFAHVFVPMVINDLEILYISPLTVEGMQHLICSLEALTECYDDCCYIIFTPLPVPSPWEWSAYPIIMTIPGFYILSILAIIFLSVLLLRMRKLTIINFFLFLMCFILPCLMASHRVVIPGSIASYQQVVLEFFSIKTSLPISEFAPISIYLVISLLLSLILIGVSFAFTSKGSAYPDKLSAYECGFDPFDDARSRFDIRFYLVSLLFIIFDLEVTFLFPWAVSLNKMGWFGFWSMMVFVWILTIGFLYEWKKGALDWE